MKRKIRKMKSRRVDRDILGTPQNRAKTWGSKDKSPKKDRRDIKQDIQEYNN